MSDTIENAKLQVGDDLFEAYYGRTPEGRAAHLQRAKDHAERYGLDFEVENAKFSRALEEKHEDELREQESEIQAENAWLVAAEAPTADDLAFEQWERAHCLNDPQSGYNL